jgi:periplasmic divalent cation tolerance protein
MANKGKAIVVLVTCKSPAEARRIVRAVVTRRLAACGNVIAAPVTSIYRWKGRVERARETLLILKSTSGAFPRLEKEIRRLHSYEVPEIIALPIISGSKAYLAWIRENIR